MLKIKTPHVSNKPPQFDPRPELTEVQEKGIRAVQSELDRFYKSLLRAADILLGIDEIITALQVPIQSPIGAPFHSSVADALIAISDWQDDIRSTYYDVLFPSLARSSVVAFEIQAAIRDMERAA